MLIFDFGRISKWVSGRTECSIPDRGAAIAQLDSNGEIVAGVMYENFTGASVTATIVIKHGAIVGKGFVKYIFEYPFDELKVNKIFAMVNETNQSSIDFVTRCGFVREAVIEGYFSDGDMIVFACTPESCKWHKED